MYNIYHQIPNLQIKRRLLFTIDLIFSHIKNYFKNLTSYRIEKALRSNNLQSLLKFEQSSLNEELLSLCQLSSKDYNNNVFEKIVLLLKARADVNYIKFDDNSSKTPLSYSLSNISKSNENIKLTNLLLENDANPNQKFSVVFSNNPGCSTETIFQENISPLEFAIRQHSENQIRLLLKKGGSIEPERFELLKNENSTVKLAQYYDLDIDSFVNMCTYSDDNIYSKEGYKFLSKETKDILEEHIEKQKSTLKMDNYSPLKELTMVI